VDSLFTQGNQLRAGRDKGMGHFSMPHAFMSGPEWRIAIQIKLPNRINKTENRYFHKT
jgi:hypothetical protein